MNGNTWRWAIGIVMAALGSVLLAWGAHVETKIEKVDVTEARLNMILQSTNDINNKIDKMLEEHRMILRREMR